MENYVCKLSSENEMQEKWDYEIAIHPDESNWKIWKASAINRVKTVKALHTTEYLTEKLSRKPPRF